MDKQPLLRQFTGTEKGWKRILASMVQPIMARFDYYALGPKSLGRQPSPSAVKRTATCEFQITTSSAEATLEELLMWLLREVDGPLVRLLSDRPVKAVNVDGLAEQLDPDEYALVLPGHPAQDSRIPPLGFNISFSPVLPEDQLLVRSYHVPATPGWHRENIKFELVSTSPDPEGGLAARARAQFSWQADPPNSLTLYRSLE